MEEVYSNNFVQFIVLYNVSLCKKTVQLNYKNTMDLLQD